MTNERCTIRNTRKPRGFEVIAGDGQVLAAMHQPRFFSRDMEGTIKDGAVRIVSEGFWRMRYGVFLDEARAGTISTAALGQLKWALSLAEQPLVELRFTTVGPWHRRYQLRVTKDHPLLKVVPKFHWATFSTTYTVEIVGAGISADQMPLMLVLAGFSANLKRARAQAAGAAAGA